LPVPSSSAYRLLRFWSGHLLLLNVALFTLVWLLYGDLTLHGFGEAYAARATDFWLQHGTTLYRSMPGIENVLLPAIAAAFRFVWVSIGLEYTTTTFLLIAVVPYWLFVWGLTRHIGRRSRGGRLTAVAAAIAIYTSGMVPYMTTWGGYPDGLSYLAMLPVIVRPDSLPLFVVAFVLQCLNHNLGAIALVLLAGIWHTLRAIDMPGNGRDALSYWAWTCGPRLVISAIILAGFVWFWTTEFPLESRPRWTILAEKWSQPDQTLEEILLRFPWTLLSALKLTVVPVGVFMMLPQARRRLRMLVVSIPFIAASVLTFAFLDITRVATLLIMPSLLVTIHAASAHDIPAIHRRRLRRLLVGTALLNLLIPNYYVNNAGIHVPVSRAIRDIVSVVASDGHE
jgi:hypothetical protein